MRLWRPWRRYADPRPTGRLLDGRRYDGDTVRPPGQPRWADLLDAEHTRPLPIITRGMRHHRSTFGFATPIMDTLRVQITQPGARVATGIDCPAKI